MNLKYVTCSGANEYTDAEALFNLFAEFPMIEFGIQVSGEKCSFASDRYAWLIALHKAAMRKKIALPLSLHLNKDWVEKFCAGQEVAELNELLNLKNAQGKPFFQRIQLNFKIGREKRPNIKILEKTMLGFPSLRFILSYNQKNAVLIEKLYQRKKVVFDCLYDESWGEGVLPKQRMAPVFCDVLQGYAGGLSPENVTQELDEIASKLPCDAQFYIDAEGKIKGNDGHFSFANAHDFVENAYLWGKQNSCL